MISEENTSVPKQNTRKKTKLSNELYRTNEAFERMYAAYAQGEKRTFEIRDGSEGHAKTEVTLGEGSLEIKVTPAEVDRYTSMTIKRNDSIDTDLLDHEKKPYVINLYGLHNSGLPGEYERPFSIIANYLAIPAFVGFMAIIAGAVACNEPTIERLCYVGGGILGIATSLVATSFFDKSLPPYRLTQANISAKLEQSYGITKTVEEIIETIEKTDRFMKENYRQD